MPARSSTFESWSKWDLIALCDRLLEDDPSAVEECVAFMELETLGLWHGRARAVMSRRLKHCTLTSSQRELVTRAILGRLVRGRFSEGFKDQLRLVLSIDPERAFTFAREMPTDAPEHAHRYADWVLAHKNR